MNNDIYTYKKLIRNLRNNLHENLEVQKTHINKRSAKESKTIRVLRQIQSDSR